MAKEKVYPVRFGELVAARCAERGIEAPPVVCMWQMPGPKNTAVAWIECYAIGAAVAIVETFKNGGWDVFTPCQNGNIDATVDDAVARCNRPMK